MDKKRIHMRLASYEGISSNNRGRTENSKTTLQMIRIGGEVFPILTGTCLRNGILETMIKTNDGSFEFNRKRDSPLKFNRKRLHSENQLAVEYESYLNPRKYADDDIRGGLQALSKDDRKTIQAQMGDDFVAKRSSPMKVSIFVSSTPYLGDTIMFQSPKTTFKALENPSRKKTTKKGEDVDFSNSDNSSLLVTEAHPTFFQGAITLAVDDFIDPTRVEPLLLGGIDQMSDEVAGNHSRALMDFSPCSVILRVTNDHCARMKTRCFETVESCPEVIDLLKNEDYDPSEFILGGEIVKKMDKETASKLKELGASLHRTTTKAFEESYERLGVE